MADMIKIEKELDAFQGDLLKSTLAKEVVSGRVQPVLDLIRSEFDVDNFIARGFTMREKRGEGRNEE